MVTAFFYGCARVDQSNSCSSISERVNARILASAATVRVRLLFHWPLLARNLKPFGSGWRGEDLHSRKTFAEIMEDVIAVKVASFRNEKHRDHAPISSAALLALSLWSAGNHDARALLASRPNTITAACSKTKAGEILAAAVI